MSDLSAVALARPALISPITASPPPAEPDWCLRPLQAGDIDGLMAVQAACYPPDYLEDAALYAQRLGSAHQQSLGIECRRTQRLQAYAAAYWSNPGKVTPLRGGFAAPAPGEQLLYLHDMAVAPDWAGRGAARRLLDGLFQRARAHGLRAAALVSVQGSQPYWTRQGFVRQELPPGPQRENLLSYGEDAVYMLAAL